MLITPEYLRQNLLLHDLEPTYGTSSAQYAPAVRTLCKAYGTHDVLDYGCGKGRLADALEFPIQQYDPAIPGQATEPLPADIVVCGDVMEHIEPECVNDVLQHIHSLTQMCAYWIIATRPAAKSLPDGRNCHLIVEPTAGGGKRCASTNSSLLRRKRVEKARPSSQRPPSDTNINFPIGKAIQK